MLKDFMIGPLEMVKEVEEIKDVLQYLFLFKQVLELLLISLKGFLQEDEYLFEDTF